MSLKKTEISSLQFFQFPSLLLIYYSKGVNLYTPLINIYYVNK